MITGLELLIVTIAAVVVAIAVSARIFLKERRIRNNVRRAQLAARISAFEVIAFELGKVAGYDWRESKARGAIAPITNEQRRAMRAAYDEAKTDLIDWVQETFKIDRGSS